MNEILIKEKLDNGMFMLTLNRPHMRNAINFQMIDELHRAIDEAKNNFAIKMVVIKGAGERAFCSGGDLSEFHDLITEQEAYGMLSKMGEVLYELATLPKPTIAYINGAAVGGGCEIAAACDIRVANHQAKMGFVQANLAITTGWGGGTLILEKMVPSQALQMLWSAEVISAFEAKENGFVSEIIYEDGDLSMFLEKFVKKPLGSLQAYKEILLRRWRETDLKERIHEEIVTCSKLWEKEEHHIAVDGFRNRKK
ncbi:MULTISPECIES: enoyl-CoA hydratase/isomerase family protein [Bacillus]|uniref:enoyl-CoA hydratase/isomerase family protein n=1 Tax=Bacillus TaxID=1386 RepID=UPI0002FF7247|nr:MULTISPECIES: enoyl-CoA hydratase/isomerase family protein [Bacillus]